jgi:hypothetical protein
MALTLAPSITGSALAPNQDADVVLVDHFENATAANYVSGSVTYVDGPSGFGRAADFTSGSWVRYTLPNWQTGPWNSPTGKQGTVDFWVYPMQINKVLLDINWYSTQSMPASGHVLSFIIGEDARLYVSTWPAYGFVSAATIPINTWTHIWFTWGAEGTRLYLNDELDSSFTDNKFPALNPTSYLYVPAWTQPGIGHIDELRVRRTYERVPCALYPIALASSTIAEATPGQSLANVFNSTGGGNFGWLSWTGVTQTTDLPASLTPPGNSDTYFNSSDPTDHEVSAGDWVVGYAGVNNSADVRARLDALVGAVITVPVWDAVSGRGDAMKYHVSGFAQLRIVSYDLPAKRITAVYVGPTTCPK